MVGNRIFLWPRVKPLDRLAFRAAARGAIEVNAKALPTKTFYTDGRMEFGPHEIRYGYLGQAHTDGDIYLHLPKSNVIVSMSIRGIRSRKRTL